MSEATKQAYVMKKLRELFPEGEWEKATVTNRRGSPDIKGKLLGFYIAIEMKANDKLVPKMIQQYRIYQINRDPQAYAFHASSWEEVKGKLFTFFATKGFPDVKGLTNGRSRVSKTTTNKSTA